MKYSGSKRACWGSIAELIPQKDRHSTEAESAPTEEEKNSMAGPVGIVALIAVVGGGLYYKSKQSA